MTSMLVARLPVGRAFDRGRGGQGLGGSGRPGSEGRYRLAVARALVGVPRWRNRRGFSLVWLTLPRPAPLVSALATAPELRLSTRAMSEGVKSAFGWAARWSRT